jgi:hypothetical protein
MTLTQQGRSVVNEIVALVADVRDQSGRAADVSDKIAGRTFVPRRATRSPMR